jgi:hypothetical protein
MRLLNPRRFLRDAEHERRRIDTSLNSPPDILAWETAGDVSDNS